MSHKYLQEIVDLGKTHYNWSKNTGRDLEWKEQRNTYGFDERETWDLGYPFFCWLYERLRMYDEINCIDTNFHQININGEKLTQQECIDRMILGCKYYITKVTKVENEDVAFEVGKEVLDIWKECFPYMWW